MLTTMPVRLGVSTPQRTSVSAQKSFTFRGNLLEPISPENTMKHNLKIFLKRIALIAGVGAASLGILGVEKGVQQGSSYLATKYKQVDSALLNNIIKEIPR